MTLFENMFYSFAYTLQNDALEIADILDISIPADESSETCTGP